MVSRSIATIDEERGGAVYSVTVVKNKKQIVSATDLDPSGEDYVWSIKLWDIETEQCVKTFTNFECCRYSRCRVLSVDDETFICWFSSIGLLVLYNIASNEYVKKIDTWVTVNRFCVLDRDRFLIGTEYGDVSVWSFDSGEHLRTFHLDDNNSVNSISKIDDRSFFCAVGRKVLVCDVETGEVMKNFDVNGGTDSISVVDNKTFLTTHFGDTVNVRNANTGECLHTATTGHTNQMLPVSGHGVLHVGFGRAEINLWGSKMDKVKKCFNGHNGTVMSIDLLSATSFISGSRDGTIKIWDLSRWPDLKTLVCLRKLVVLGRAEKSTHSNLRRSKRLREGISSKKCGRRDISAFLATLVCETPDDIFRKVLSFIA